MPKFFSTRIKKPKVKDSSGFTLSDLLVGAGLTTVVVAGGGAAIASMLDASHTANAKSERRVEMNRALEFISTEVNRSTNLVRSPSMSAELVAQLSSSSLNIDVATVQPVLQLNIPGNSTNRVTYFTAEAVNGTWRGPQVLYRWGPTFSANGTYDNPDDTSTWDTLALIDRLENFNASVSDSFVQLNPVGRIQKLLGRSETYGVSKNALTKGGFVAANTFTPPGGASATFAKTPLFDITTGNLEVLRDSKIEIDFLGGEMSCGGRNINTRAQINLIQNGTSRTVTDWKAPSGTLNYDVGSNTTLNVVGKKIQAGNGCYIRETEISTLDDQDRQVLTLADGDTVPKFTPYGGQQNIDAFMTDYIDEDGKVTLDENQVIFLFELWGSDKDEDYYDLQDMVVLATITPTTTESLTESEDTTTEMGETTYSTASN